MQLSVCSRYKSLHGRDLGDPDDGDIGGGGGGVGGAGGLDDEVTFSQNTAKQHEMAISTILTTLRFMMVEGLNAAICAFNSFDYFLGPLSTSRVKGRILAGVGVVT